MVSWEKELVKELDVTWGDAQTILQIAKDELGIQQKDYPEESKQVIFEKCHEVSENFEKTPKPETGIHSRDSRRQLELEELARKLREEEEENDMPDEDVPDDEQEDLVVAKKPRPPTWEKQLVKELDVTWKDAKAILQISKHELEIEEKEYPEGRKEEIFQKCHEIAETFPKSAKVVPMLHPSLSKTSTRDDVLPAAEPGAKGSTTRGEPIMTSQGEYGANDKVDRNKLTIAIAVLIVVIAIIVGVAVGVKNRNKSNEEGIGAATTTPPETTPPECTSIVMDFAVPALSLTLAVDSGITVSEYNYAADVFTKTYSAMLNNDFDSSATNYCDPYCREITGVVVINTEWAGNTTDSNFQDNGCNAYLEMIFEVEGTYVGCDGTPFPGLFANPSVTRRFLSDLATIPFSKSFLRGGGLSSMKEESLDSGHRYLQPTDGAACGECSAEGEITPIAPTTEELTQQLEPFITVLPSVCEISALNTLEVEK